MFIYVSNIECILIISPFYESSSRTPPHPSGSYFIESPIFLWFQTACRNHPVKLCDFFIHVACEKLNVPGWKTKGAAGEKVGDTK